MNEKSTFQPRLKAPLAGATPPELGERQIFAFVEQEAPRLELPTDPADWLARASDLRSRCRDLLLRGHPTAEIDAAVPVEWTETLEPGPSYRIHKLRYEGYPGVWVPALLYEPVSVADHSAQAAGATPAVLDANGHGPATFAVEHKQARCINLAKRGLLTLSIELVGRGETTNLIAHNQQLLLDVVGQCGAGVFFLVMKRALDLLLSLPATDPGRVAMTGLSGGGWQTILLSALDERVALAAPVAGHMPVWSRRDCADIGDAEQLPADLCTVADYDVLSALIAPRPTLFMYNKYDDCCFQAHKAVPGTYEPARAAFALLGVSDRCTLHVSTEPGHNYGAENRSQFYQWLNRHFALDTPPEDLPWESEKLTPAELAVGLPPTRRTFATMAAGRLEQLRRDEAQAGRRVERAALDRVLRWRDSAVTAAEVVSSWFWLEAEEKQATGGQGAGLPARDVRVEELVIEVDSRWLLPARSAVFAEGTLAIVAIGDTSIPDDEALAARAFAMDHTLLYVDLIGFGVLCPRPQYALLLHALGRPLLGLQVAQLGAIATWLRKGGSGPITVETKGRAASVVALLAAARTPGAFAQIETSGMPRSLDEIVESPLSFTGSDEALFCHGLRAELDIPDLLALAAPVKIRDRRLGVLR